MCEFLLAVIIPCCPTLLESGTQTEGGWIEFVPQLQAYVNIVVDFLIFKFYFILFYFLDSVIFRTLYLYPVKLM